MVEEEAPLGCSRYLYAPTPVWFQFILEGCTGSNKRMRKASYPREGLTRGAWTSQEDKLLSEYIMVHGLGKWRSLPANAGLNRCAKSCRLRWMNYLRPDIKRGNITDEEEELIIRLHRLLGNRWSLIAGRLPGRTDNEIKNYWNTYIRKKGLTCSRKSKQVHLAEAVADKLKESEVSVIRTKAVRCTRSLFTDQVPKSGVYNISYSVPPTALVDHETFLDFMVHGPTPQGANMICSVENTQDSIFPRADDSTNTHSFHDSFSASASSNDFNYTSIYESELEDGEGLRPFVCDDDAWISVLMPPDN